MLRLPNEARDAPIALGEKVESLGKPVAAADKRAFDAAAFERGDHQPDGAVQPPKPAAIIDMMIELADCLYRHTALRPKYLFKPAPQKQEPQTASGLAMLMQAEQERQLAIRRDLADMQAAANARLLAAVYGRPMSVERDTFGNVKQRPAGML